MAAEEQCDDDADQSLPHEPQMLFIDKIFDADDE
tara:strand:- start:674 stop:775 length:102 start_codon:yes stop_codon:yes gene_type:complete